MSTISDEQLYLATAKRLAKAGEKKLALGILKVIRYDQQARDMARSIRASMRPERTAWSYLKIALLVVGLCIIAGFVLMILEQQRLASLEVQRILEGP